MKSFGTEFREGRSIPNMAAYRLGYHSHVLSQKSAGLATQMFGFSLLIARANELFGVWSKFLTDSSCFNLFCGLGILIAEVTDRLDRR